MSIVNLTGTGPDDANLVVPRTSRGAGTLHRNAVAAVDKVAVAGTLTLSDQTASGGGLAISTTYYVNVAPFNRWGSAGAATITSLATSAAAGATHSLRVAWAQVAGADGYDLFLSTDATGPKWVARVTEAQRATGGVVNVIATGYAAGGVAGAIDIGVVGTGLGSNVAPFTTNNAYRPDNVTVFSTAGRSKVHVLVKLAVTDLRSLPSLTLIPFLGNQASAVDFHQGTAVTLSLLGATGQSLEQDFELDVDGASSVVVLVDAIGGQGAAASVWLEAA